MNKHICIAISMICITLAGCKKDEKSPAVKPSDPFVPQKITIFETKVTEDISMDAKDEFIYTSGLLVKYRHTQAYSGAVALNTDIIYEGDMVFMTDNHGITTEYELDENGYATHCLYMVNGELAREFEFTYTDGYLTKSIHKIHGVVASTEQFSYENGDLKAMTLDGCDYTCFPTERFNRVGLPDLIVVESYPFHLIKEAFYGGLLGKPTSHLVDYMELIDGMKEVVISYTYKFDTAFKPISIGVGIPVLRISRMLTLQIK